MYTNKPTQIFSFNLSDTQFNALLKLFANDVSSIADFEVVALRELLNDESALRGYRNWIDAFNGRLK
jgi:hypothetical protein